MTLQQHIETILDAAVFNGELFYIKHPDPDGVAVSAPIYGVYSIVGGESFQNLEGDIDISRPRVQISVYAKDKSTLIATVAAVSAAMIAAATLAQTSDPSTTAAALFNRSASVPVDGHEEETGRFYSHMDYYCWI